MKSGAFWDKSPANSRTSIGAMVYERSRTQAQKLFQLCVDLSPVDTGAYRASWTLSEGSPEYSFVGRRRSGNKVVLPPPSTPRVSTKFYRKLYVANGAPYAMRLELGWSEQAPAGVMREAMSRIKDA